MAARTGGRGNSHGIHGEILGAAVGSTGAVLETDRPETRRRWPDVGKATFGASTIESRSARAQEGFPRCRTSGKATGGQRADPEFRTRSRTANLTRRWQLCSAATEMRSNAWRWCPV